MPILNDISGDKMVELRSVFARLSHSDHPVRLNCDPCGICKAARLRELDVVKLIEGKS